MSMKNSGDIIRNWTHYLSGLLCSASANCVTVCPKGKAIPLQAWTDPEGSRRLKPQHSKPATENYGYIYRYFNLTLSLLISYIYIYIHTYIHIYTHTCIYVELLIKPEILTLYIYGPTFDNAERRLFLFAAQCFNTESMQKVSLWHSCV
jgi:hypothetical protein